jgi:hypothetical protein
LAAPLDWSSAILSTDPAILPSQPLMSGNSIKASSRPATQKMCWWVKSAIRPNTATISNCNL